jgi:hypothetical protein
MAQKRRKQADDGLSELNYQTLNEDFYAGDPADYFMQRLSGLLLLKGKPEAIRALLADGIETGGVRIQLQPGTTPDARSEEEDTESRDRFFTADAWLLLHHASETLLRLYLAHAKGVPCPALEIARERQPGSFKKKVFERFMRSSPSPEHHGENGVVFYGSPTAAGLVGYDEDGRNALLSNVEGLLRLFASIFLDAEAYNAIKHSMAIRTGNSRLEVKVDDMDLGTTQGPHIEYVGIRQTQERSVWARKTLWFDFDLIVAQVYVAQRLILALWLMARHQYLGAELDSVPPLGSPTRDELLRSESITWTSMARDLLYDQLDDTAEQRPRDEEADPPTGEGPDDA